MTSEECDLSIPQKLRVVEVYGEYLLLKVELGAPPTKEEFELLTDGLRVVNDEIIEVAKPMIRAASEIAEGQYTEILEVFNDLY